MAARKKVKKKISLSEFKAWLEGADDFHGKDWAPTPEQWKMIREKIDNIEEPKPEIREVVKEVPVEVPTGRAVGAHSAQVPAEAQPSERPLPPNIPPPPPVPGGVPSGEVVAGPKTSSLAPPPPDIVPSAMPHPSTSADVPGGKSVTPNIDTSDGNYQSGFV